MITFELKAKEEQSSRLAKRTASELVLPFKMIEARYTFDARRAVFTFGPEQRADFRRLIHQPSKHLHCRVELKEVGARDEARLIGGIGRSGMTLCCSTWSTEFSTVTVRMAKEQALPISAEVLAGQCGRLRCSLKYEYEQYRAVNNALPKIGERVGTPWGEAKVLVGRRVKETVPLLYPGEVVRELPLSEVTRYASSRN